MSSKLPPSGFTGELASPLGGAFAQHPRVPWEIATVQDYSPNTQTYTCVSGRGKPLQLGRLIRAAGELEIIPRGTLVAVHQELGFPIIDGILKLPNALAPEIRTQPSVTEYDTSRNKTVYPTPGREFDGETPKDVLEGDWVKSSPEGNFVGVLGGGVNVMASSPTAQVRTISSTDGDLVDVIAAAFRMINDMGELNVVNNGGKHSLIWRAGADARTETGLDERNWTIHLDIGESGNIFQLRFTDAEGHTKAEIRVSAEGRLSLLGMDGLDLVSGNRGASTETHIGKKKEDYETKDVTIKEGSTESVGGRKTTTVGGNHNETVGGDANKTTGGSEFGFIGGMVKQKILGGLVPTPGGIAGKYEYINGTVETVIGNPAAGGIPSAIQGANVITYVGPLNFVIQPIANPVPPVGGFNVMSSLPMSVNLGVDGACLPNPATGGHTAVPIPAPFGVMKFEPWVLLMQALVAYIDSHTHLIVAPSPGTPTGPPIPGPPIVGAAAGIMNPGTMAAVRSVRVGVGL